MGAETDCALGWLAGQGKISSDLSALPDLIAISCRYAVFADFIEVSRCSVLCALLTDAACGVLNHSGSTRRGC